MSDAGDISGIPMVVLGMAIAASQDSAPVDDQGNPPSPLPSLPDSIATESHDATPAATVITDRADPRGSYVTRAIRALLNVWRP